MKRTSWFLSLSILITSIVNLILFLIIYPVYFLATFCYTVYLYNSLKMFQLSSILDFVFLHFRVLSALAYWSPIFGEADFLPMVAFPFVKLFPNNHLICFEFIATVIRKYSPFLSYLSYFNSFLPTMPWLFNSRFFWPHFSLHSGWGSQAFLGSMAD